MFDLRKSTVAIPSDIIPSIYQLKSLDPDHINRSTRGGWTSKDVTGTQPLLAGLDVTHAWFNINPSGAHNEWHSHYGIPTSGVVYIQIPNNSGDIEFRDNDYNLTITPISGLMIQFPGHVEHRVTVNHSKQDRICLVFNIGGRKPRVGM
jgi:hypothetical protein